MACLAEATARPRSHAMVLAALLLAACRAAPDGGGGLPSGTPPAASALSAGASPQGATTATETATPATIPCPDTMVLVSGDYCSTVQHRCLAHTKEYEREQEQREKSSKLGVTLPMSRISERCLRYEKPAHCLANSRERMRFCVDRYEWPNEAGKLPELAVTWLRAKQQCEAAGKRLCGVEEFNFACEGEAMLPYTYGFERDASRCNIDKPYVRPLEKATPYDDCLKLPYCKARLAELDQRSPSGAMPGCASPFGVMDMNGNVNEWVSLEGEKAPWRSGLKGGWWGPARGRCRPTVTAHNEIYAGYEVGFRCCKDAPPLRAEAATEATP